MTIRNRIDALLEVSKAFPAAAGNNTTDAIDLEQVAAGELENVVVELDIPATTTLVADKTATFTLQHKATSAASCWFNSRSRFRSERALSSCPWKISSICSSGFFSAKRSTPEKI